MAPESEPRPRPAWTPVNGEAAPTTPAAAPTSEPNLTPTKPTMPAWIQREAVPHPVDEAEAEVIAPVKPPAASELLPTLGDDTGDVAAPSPGEGHSLDPVQRLGETAAANAALSAGGAPTPLGGVPTVAPAESITPPWFGDDVPAFTPTFAGAEPEPEPSSREKADALAAGIVAEEHERLASAGAAFDTGAAYTPTTFETGPEAPGETPADAAAPSGGKKRRWWLWVLIAVAVVAVAGVLFAVLNPRDPNTVPGVVVTQPAAAPTISPIAVPTATAFQAAMPATVATYALTEATPLVPADIALTAGRVADGVDLVYRSGEDTMKVRALQYFNEADATQMFTQFAGEDATTTPVMADGQSVGESAVVTSPNPGIVWRNGTSVFILTGPPTQLAGFFADFGL